jgi:sugar/nucleoside kinase (ribokinase family)
MTGTRLNPVDDQLSLLPIVVVGSVVLDLTPPLLIPEDRVFRDMLTGGHVIELGPLVSRPGGSVSNTGISLHRLGIPVDLIGQIGDDLQGRELKRIFKAEGIAGVHLSVASQHTAYTIVLAPPGTDRIFLHYPGANDHFSADDIDWGAVKHAGILHIGYPALLPRLYADGGRPLAALLERAKAAGATTSMDMCMVPPDSDSAAQDWPAILARVLPLTDILLPGAEEILFFVQREVYDELNMSAGGAPVLSTVELQHVTALGEQLVEMGAGVVGLKMGERGMYARTGSADRLQGFGRVKPAELENWARRELWEPSFQPRRFATATGAGDAAVAGFLAALTRGYGLSNCLRMATALGAQNLEAMDATSSIRSWSETVGLLEEGWPKNHLSIDSAGWRFDASLQAWEGPHELSGSKNIT